MSNGSDTGTMAAGKRSWWARRPGETEKAHNSRVGGLGCGLLFVAVIVLVVLITSVTHGGGGGRGDSSAWQTIGTQLALTAKDHDDAATANNPAAMLRAEQSTADKCQEAGHLGPGGDQEQRVRAYCTSVGHPVP